MQQNSWIYSVFNRTLLGLFINPNGEIPNVYFRDGLGNEVHAEGATPLNDGNWHYLVGIRDGQNGHLYVDGALVATASNPSIGTITTSTCTYARIGASMTGPGHCTSTSAAGAYFKGLIDEVEIYNRALTITEIQATYNAGNAGHCTSTPPPVCVNPPSGLVSWWPGDDNANDIEDSNHGALQNGASFASGLVDQTFSFDGVDDHVLLPQSNDWNFATGDFTVDFWEKSSNNTRRMHALSFEPNYGISNLDFDFNDPDLFGAPVGLWVYWNSSGINRITVGSVGAYTDGQWHFIALARSGTTMTLYVDGSPVGSTNYSPAIDLSNSNLNFIGASQVDGSSPTFFWDGSIDEVEIFNRALSASEIQSIYNAGSAGKCKECEPPTADAGEDQTICPGVSVQLGGDPTGSGNGTLTYSWEPTDGLSDASAANPTTAPTSTTTYTVTVTDANECAATDEVTVTVEDNEAPVITIATNPITLWPPNHQYLTINISQCVAAVTDNCATLSPNNVIIANVTSDEPEDAQGGGDGNTTNDIVIANDCKSVQLRSERQGSGNGRVYTIHLSLSDGNGNTGAATCLVTVPKSQNGSPAVDDGAVYTVNGSCPSGSLTKAAITNDLQEEAEVLPEGYSLEQNYPNPFNPTTEIAFALPEAGQVTVRIYSETGQLVRQLASGNFASGKHQLVWDAKDEKGSSVATGIYFYQIVVQKQNGEAAFTQMRRMTFVK